MKNSYPLNCIYGTIHIIGIGNIARTTILNLAKAGIENLKLASVYESIHNNYAVNDSASVNIINSNYSCTPKHHHKISIKSDKAGIIINRSVLKKLDEFITDAKKIILISRFSSDFDAVSVPVFAKLANVRQISITCIILQPYEWEGSYINNLSRIGLNELIREAVDVVLVDGSNNLSLSQDFSINGFLKNLSDGLTKAVINHLNVETNYKLFKDKSVTKKMMYDFDYSKDALLEVQDFEYNIINNKWRI